MNEPNRLLTPYGFQCEEFEKLDGYASINYRVRHYEKNHLLKHYTNPEEFSLISAEDSILQELNKSNLPFLIPASLQEMARYEDGSFSRLLPFIEGDLLSSVDPSDLLMNDFGRAVGHLNKELLDVKNDTIQARELFWDMKHALLNEHKKAFIEDPKDRKLITYYFDLFEHHILPVQHQLRYSIIHSDLNDNNIIIADQKVSGIIDFGDITYSPLIYEVAIAATYIMLANEKSPFDMARAFIQGYHSVLPLKKEEIELLYLLIPSRLCVSVCNSAKKKAEGADTEYVLISEKPAWNLLRKWISINPIWITNFFLEAINCPIPQLDKESLKKERANFTGRSLGTSYDEPIYISGAAFQYMYDDQGNTYLDVYNNIPHIGHGHPGISKAISSQIRKLNTNTRYLYPEFTEYASALGEKLPANRHKFFFVNSGSAASDLAVRMALTHTGQKSIAILENGYHGNTMTGIAISDYKHNGKGGNGRPENIISLPLPKEYLGACESGIEYAEDAINQLQNHIREGNKPAALIVEPISGCGGQVPLASGYLQHLAPFLEENDILLIMDEVQTGFGRLGNYFWGFEMHGVVPDLVIMGKPMGNGHPIAAVVTHAAIADSFDNGMEFFTSFGGNPVSCKVALKVLQTIEEERLQENAVNVGQILKNGLMQLKRQFDCIADVRGEGLFLGVEFSLNGQPGEQIASFVKEDLKRKFILVGTDGPHNNVIKIKPPMCFNQENAQFFLASIKDSIEQAN